VVSKRDSCGKCNTAYIEGESCIICDRAALSARQDLDDQEEEEEEEEDQAEPSSKKEKDRCGKCGKKYKKGKKRCGCKLAP